MYITHDNQTYPGVRVYATSRSVRFTGESLTGVSALAGTIKVFANDGFELCSITPGDYLRQELADGTWLLTNVPLPEPQPVTAEPVTYDLLTSAVNMTRFLMKGAKPTTADEIIRCSAIYEEWEVGVHSKDDIYTVSGDPWECLQDYDNAVYPDIAPGKSAWYTFNRPYHGTSRETARNFVHPTGAHDIYKAGEWAIQGGKFTECVLDTSYSMEEYAAAWEVRE